MKKFLIIFSCIAVLLILYKQQHIRLMADPKDSPIFQQRLKTSFDKSREEDYLARQQKMQAGKKYGDKTSPAALSPVNSRDLVITGRCGKATLTWFEQRQVGKQNISVKRKVKDRDFAVLETPRIYERQEEKGFRYWVFDSDLTDGATYEYSIAVRESGEKVLTKGPVKITLTCTENDKEIEARMEARQKKPLEPGEQAPRPAQYQLSEKTYTIAIGDSPHKGKKNAPVTMVVFSDFECSYCAAWAWTLESITKLYPNEVRLVYKNYPLRFHKNAEYAARAALAAQEQGKFWEMYELLFKNQKALERENLLTYAKIAGLDPVKFQQDIEKDDIKKRMAKDLEQGSALGFKGVPATFINGRMLSGAPPLSYVKQLVEETIKKSK